MHTYIHTYSIYIYIYTYMYIYVYIHLYVYIYIYTHTYTHTPSREMRGAAPRRPRQGSSIDRYKVSKDRIEGKYR